MSLQQALRIELVAVPAGGFLMGSDRELDPASKYKTEPERIWLDLPAFHIGKYQVTVGEYRPFVDAAGYRLGEDIWGYYGRVWREKNRIAGPFSWDDPVWTGDERLPVMNLCWYEAMAYCRWLTSTMGVQKYQLPMEAEWEKAARGTDGRIYPWGDAFDASRCNSGREADGPLTEHRQLYDFTVPVGSYPEGASPFGAMDMSGNVEEWCLDKGIDLFRYPEEIDPRRKPANRDPDAPARRVLRGGDYHGLPGEVRAAARRGLDAEWRGGGFRVATG